MKATQVILDPNQYSSEIFEQQPSEAVSLNSKKSAGAGFHQVYYYWSVNLLDVRNNFLVVKTI